MENEITRKVKSILSDVNLKRVTALINSINLSEREKYIIIKTELEGKCLQEVAEKLCLSNSSVSMKKSEAIKKIYTYCCESGILN